MEMVVAAGPNLPPLARFAIVLLAMVAVPLVARRLRLPNCVGFIAVGVIIGPHVLGILPRHTDVADFAAELGKLLLMFFVGLEIDIEQFKANRRRAVLFGLATFSLPLLVGTLTALSFGYGVVSAVLVGSLLASHTLIAYPQVTEAGLGGIASIPVTVGATVLTDMLALLVLAGCLSTHASGFDPVELAKDVGLLIGFAMLMILVIGPVGRWLLHRMGNSDQATFGLMLAGVAMAATLAEAIDLEGIIGAFLAGIVVNRAVRESEAREKLEFLGNTFFIPAFFIVTGFLVDMVVLARTVVQDLPLVLAIVLGLMASKWLAAEAAGRAFGFPPAERRLMGSLTMPQVAATLAAALVGYEAVNAAGERLLDERMLNTVLVLVVATSVLGPILTQREIRAMRRKDPKASGLAAAE